MSKQEIPILGKPFFIIERNSMSDRVQLAGKDGYLNELTYFAANGIKTMSLEYQDDKMEKIIINKGMKESADPDSKSLSFVYDINKDPEDSYSIFVNEADAQAIARRMNEDQKKKCKKMVDEVAKCYHEYDAVIALCIPVGKK
jgi:hypothetical protein